MSYVGTFAIATIIPLVGLVFLLNRSAPRASAWLCRRRTPVGPARRRRSQGYPLGARQHPPLLAPLLETPLPFLVPWGSWWFKAVRPPVL